MCPRADRTVRQDQCRNTTFFTSESLSSHKVIRFVIPVVFLEITRIERIYLYNTTLFDGM